MSVEKQVETFFFLKNAPSTDSQQKRQRKSEFIQKKNKAEKNKLKWNG